MTVLETETPLTGSTLTRALGAAVAVAMGLPVSASTTRTAPPGPTR
jgi:hypothetical protein